MPEDHEHPSPSQVAVLPAPSALWGDGPRAEVIALMAALEASCLGCYRERWERLEQAQRGLLPPLQVRAAGRGSGVRSVSVGGQGQGPGPIEAMYADLVWSAWVIVLEQAGRAGTGPLAEATIASRQMQGSTDTFAAVKALIVQDGDPEAALEIAQGITTVAELLGANGLDMLVHRTEEALRVVLALAYGEDAARRR
jgi:hypothetical protein